MYTIWSYSIYLVLSISMTIWVAAMLSKHGRAFLIDSFLGNAEIADSVNRLLVVGFYLINIGFIALALKLTMRPVDVASTFEAISGKMGQALMFIGGAHFFNLYVFSRIRRRALDDARWHARAAHFDIPAQPA